MSNCFVTACVISLLHYLWYLLCICIMLIVFFSHLSVQAHKRFYLRRHNVYATVLFAVEQSSTEFHFGFFQFAE